MSETLPLASEFPAPSEADWLAAVRGVLLKGKPDATDADFTAAFERQLVHRTADGIAVQPLYTHAAAPAPSGAPGEAPYTRGTRSVPAPWEIRQRVFPTAGANAAVTELESGATGVLVELTESTATALAAQLEGVHLELAPVSIATPPHDDGVTGGHLLIDLWDARDTPLADRAGTLGVDPIGAWARSGGTTDLAAGFAGAAELISRVAYAPDTLRVVVADGTVWHDAGATPAQELAWNVAAAVESVRRLGDGARSRIEFRWAADADQFTTIAKLRAARQLWARAADGAPSYHHADGSRVMLTRYDTWTNALRSTVACFAAAVGGAAAITVWPHDALVEPGGTALGRRIARNTQTILQSESNLWRVLDIAGGSWYVESLTEQLAAAAWAELVRLDELGGLVAAIEAGHVHAALDQVLAERSARLATRKQPLTGLSEFPNIDEEPPPPAAAPPGPAATPFAPLGLQRLAAGFEAQRGRADAAFRATGERPTVYLATLGTPAEFTARTTFAKNLFEAGGIRTVTGPADGFAGGMVCLCSSDARYADSAAAALAEVRAAGATRVYLAGRSLDQPDAAAQVDEFVGLGADVLSVLTRALDHLLGEEVSA